MERSQRNDQRDGTGYLSGHPGANADALNAASSSSVGEISEQQIDLLTSVEYASLTNSQNEYIIELQRQINEMNDRLGIIHQQ